MIRLTLQTLMYEQIIIFFIFRLKYLIDLKSAFVCITNLKEAKAHIKVVKSIKVNSIKKYVIMYDTFTKGYECFMDVMAVNNHKTLKLHHFF